MLPKYTSTYNHLATFTIYIGSAIYAPSMEGVMKEFGVSEIVASLGLALYVISC
jgi:DHA1 family multidrug resistance protein-like MFS transporter